MAESNEPPARGGQGPGHSPRRYRLWPWALLLAVALAWPLVRSLLTAPPEPPPVLSVVPAFELVDQNGDRFGREDLAGKVWVANFIFTSCGAVCPRLSETMADIQRRLRDREDRLHLVSFSVDPVRDTPPVLKAYAERYGARPGFWTFLTGPLDSIEAVIVEGFKVAMDRTEVDGFFDIVHGEHFVLVDAAGNLRGYYRADEEGVRNLTRDARVLADQPVPPPATTPPSPAEPVVSS